MVAGGLVCGAGDWVMAGEVWAGSFRWLRASRPFAPLAQVRADDVDDKCLDLLRSLTVEDGISVIDQFERAVQNGGVKNKSAYLAGVATRHKHFGHGPKLAKEVQHRLESLYRSGKMRDTVRAAAWAWAGLEGVVCHGQGFSRAPPMTIPHTHTHMLLPSSTPLPLCRCLTARC